MKIIRPRAGVCSVFLLCLVAAPSVASGQVAPEFWYVSTRACPQIMGTNPGSLLKAYTLDSRGCLARREPSELIAISTGRPVVILVHGSYYTASMAATEGVRIRNDLCALGVLPPESVVVAFDWPSQHLYPNLVKDANEKARRAVVAGYHLAWFLQGFPDGSRISLIGQSHGGLVILSALHLIGGGTLDDGTDPCRPSGLPPCGSSLRLRAILIASASDRHWLDPGERLDKALVACEAVLNLYNKLDPVLVVHPFGKYSEHNRALGKTGMSREEEERLGAMAARYRERGIGSLLGARHTFHGATANPVIAGWIGPYLWQDVRAVAGVSPSSPRPRAMPSPLP